MKQIKQLAAALALCLTTTVPASADDNIYVGLSAVLFTHNVTVPGGSGSGNSTGFMAQLGSNFNEYLGMELRFGGTGRANLTQINSTQDGSMSALLLRGRIPVNDSLRLYGLFGTSSGSITASGNLTGSAFRQSLSFGGGVEALVENWGGSVEWLRYWNKVNLGTGIDATIDGIALTVGYNF